MLAACLEARGEGESRAGAGGGSADSGECGPWDTLWPGLLSCQEIVALGPGAWEAK